MADTSQTNLTRLTLSLSLFLVGMILMSGPVWAVLIWDNAFGEDVLDALIRFLNLSNEETFTQFTFLIWISFGLLALGALLCVPSGIHLFRSFGRQDEHRRSLEKIRESEEKYRLLFSTERDGIVLFRESDGQIVDANQAALDLYGYTLDEFKTLKADALLADKKSAAAAMVDDWQVWTDEHTGEVSHVGKDGTPIPVDVSSGSFDIKGVNYTCLLVRDIRNRRKLENLVLNISSEERTRIGQDLHDGLGQELTAISLTVKILENRLKKKDLPEEAAEAARIGEMLNRSISMTRALARGLSPVNIEQHGLQPAVEDLLHNIEKNLGIKTEFSWTDGLEIPDRGKCLHLYRIIQEAVNNSIKHAQPTKISLDVTQEGQMCRILISDNGKGMDSIKGKPTSLGLQSLRYRAAMIEGTLTLSSEIGHGTQIECRFRNTPPEEPNNGHPKKASDVG